MSSQSCEEICNVRFGLVPAPGLTVQVPSLMTACQVPPPSPLTSYWIAALVPAALSARNLVGIASNVSFTVAMTSSVIWEMGAPDSLSTFEVGIALGEEGLDAF